MRLSIFILSAFLQLSAWCSLTVTIQGFNETCGHHNGQLTAIVSGGVGPYQYQWSTGATTESITGLDEGSYSVMVVDAEGTEVSSLPYPVLDVPHLETEYIGWTPFGGVPCPGECNGHFSIPLEGINGIQPYALASSYGTVDVGAFPYNQFNGICDEVPVTVTVTDALGCVGTMEVNEDGPEGYPIDIHDINPACEGQGNGSVIISLPVESGMEPAYHVIVMSMDPLQDIWAGTVWGPDPLVVPIEDLLPGAYQLVQIYYTMGESCQRIYPFTVGELTGDCGTVQGDVWYDTDGDCLYDGNEMKIPYSVQRIGPDEVYAITNDNGHYSYNLEDGAYDIGPVDPSLTPLCQPNSPIPFTIASNTVTVNMADWSDEPLDLFVQASASEARPGFDQTIWADVVNASPQAAGAVTLVCTLSLELEYLNAAPEPTSVSGNTLTWQLPGLGSFGHHHIAIQAHLPASVFLGTPVVTTVNGTSTSGEADLTNNETVISQVAIGAYDPNYKEALTSTRQSTSSYFIGEDEWIDYTIHFQNTGTASAFNVVVVDTLPEELDQSTYVQGVASHDFDVAFKPGRVVEWSFFNIQLPDSGSNEAASHGAVSFRIRPKTPLLPGTIISNAAAIYFDFNAPVITHPSLLMAEFSTATEEQGTVTMNLFPNPAHDRSFIEVPGASSTGYTVEVIGLDGRAVHRSMGSGGRHELAIQGLAAGTYLVQVRTTRGAVYRARLTKQ